MQNAVYFAVQHSSASAAQVYNKQYILHDMQYAVYFAQYAVQCTAVQHSSASGAQVQLPRPTICACLPAQPPLTEHII